MDLARFCSISMILTCFKFIFEIKLLFNLSEIWKFCIFYYCWNHISWYRERVAGMIVLLFMRLIWTIFLLCTIFLLKISTSSFCLLLANFSSYIILHLYWCYVSAKCTNTLKDIEQTIASAGGGIALNSELYDGHFFQLWTGLVADITAILIAKPMRMYFMQAKLSNLPRFVLQFVCQTSKQTNKQRQQTRWRPVFLNIQQTQTAKTIMMHSG